MEKSREMIEDARYKAQEQAVQSGLGRDITAEHELALFIPIAIDMFYELIKQDMDEEHAVKACARWLDGEVSVSEKPTLQDIEGRLRRIWGL